MDLGKGKTQCYHPASYRGTLSVSSEWDQCSCLFWMSCTCWNGLLLLHESSPCANKKITSSFHPTTTCPLPHFPTKSSDCEVVLECKSTISNRLLFRKLRKLPGSGWKLPTLQWIHVSDDLHSAFYDNCRIEYGFINNSMQIKKHIINQSTHPHAPHTTGTIR